MLLLIHSVFVFLLCLCMVLNLLNKLIRNKSSSCVLVGLRMSLVAFPIYFSRVHRAYFIWCIIILLVVFCYYSMGFSAYSHELE